MFLYQLRANNICKYQKFINKHQKKIKKNAKNINDIKTYIQNKFILQTTMYQKWDFNRVKILVRLKNT